MDFGKALRTVRARKGLSQKDVAELASLNQSYVSLIESGRRKPTLSMAEDLARALGIPVYLFMLLGSDADDLRGLEPEQAAVLGRQILDVALATNREATRHVGKPSRIAPARRATARAKPRRSPGTRGKR